MGRLQEEVPGEVLSAILSEREDCAVPKTGIGDYDSCLEAMQVEGYSDQIALAAMIASLREGRFLFSIDMNPPTSLVNFLNRAKKYSNVEELFSSRKATESVEILAKDKKCKEEVLMEVRDKRILRWPNRMKTDANKRDKRKYCHFHCDHGHATNDYFNFKEEIEALIPNGQLHEYVYRRREERPDQRIEQYSHRNDKKETGDIRAIFAGPVGGGDSNRARQTHARSISSGSLEHHINLTSRLPKEQKIILCNLTFTEEEAQGVHHPHDDVLVMAMTIANCKVHLILVDTAVQSTSSFPLPLTRWESIDPDSNPSELLCSDSQERTSPPKEVYNFR
ncbi:uncharacterized protein LOC131245365 [Magnolia sinica]|uniref:uncharacterized protein LOC131245365 n=1 Tax=Magnolia sinica TaxID=86752 RepID=UPI002659CC6A|nr:uncharacterized protein LOC131245365 [Magnolia sinica]